MELYHNSRATEYRSPYGAVAVGTALRLRLDVKMAEPERVFLRLWTGHPCADEAHRRGAI